MKNIILLFILFVSQVHANCYQKLTSDFKLDSQAFQVAEPETGWADYYDHLSIDVANQAIQILLKKMKCDREISLTNRACKQIHPDQTVSKVCFFDSNLGGFFLVTKDYLEHVNIIFNRYD